MSGLGRLLDPASIAIAGLSADPAKHGGRVLANLRKLGYRGEVWGVNPGLPEVDGVEVFPSLRDLPEPPDLVVCAVPANAVREIAMTAEGVGALVVVAGGFGESGDDGMALEADLSEWVERVGFRLLGPNSGGVIRRSKGLAASFLTCLDRPAEQIRLRPGRFGHPERGHRQLHPQPGGGPRWRAGGLGLHRQRDRHQAGRGHLRGVGRSTR